ncbi:MAG: hypothetical protein AAFQ54_08620 [Pseudomonadota bacterium]
MTRLGAALAFTLTVSTAGADPVAQCLSCHVTDDGTLDIVGLKALSALPEEWQFVFEDAFDLDADGIAGRMRFVSGADGPQAAKFGQSLAAGRFEDFAALAGAAHDVDLSEPGTTAKVRAAFEALSPAPVSPFANQADQAAFEARGCADCHTTQSFDFEGQDVMPLSDFLLHETDEGPRRTAPLWGCRSCLLEETHDWLVTIPN